jgi:O-antigen/teichoic acid export membrane protein
MDAACPERVHKIVIDILFNRAIKDIAIYFPGKLLPALAAFITIPIFARLFRPEEYGILAVIGMFTSAGGIAMSNWLTTSVIRFLPQYRQQGQLGRFYSNLLCAFALSLMVFIIVAVPAYLFVRATVSDEVCRLLPLAGGIIFISTLYAILQNVLRADQRSKLFVGFDLFQAFGALAIGLTLVIALNFGVEGILWGSFTAMTAASLGIGWWLLRQGVEIKITSVSIGTLREFTVYGLPVGIATIGSWILSLSDRYIIEFFRGTFEVGVYSMSYGLASKSINLVVSSLMLAVGPILINTWESEHRDATPQLLGQITRLTLLLVVPMVVGLSVLAVPVFRVMTTDAYLPGARALPWIALGTLLYTLNLQAYTGLIVAKKTMIMARNYIFAGLINVLLNILLVPRFGFMAAAVNTSVSYGMLLVLNIFSADKYLPWIFPWRTLWNALFASGAMALIIIMAGAYIQPSPFVLALTIVAGMGIYMILLIALQEIRSKERSALKGLVPSIAVFGIWKRFCCHKKQG